MAETTDLTVWANGIALPPGWAVRSVSVSRPYPYLGPTDMDELAVEFAHYSALLTIQTTLTFTRRGFDPAWLYEHLTLLERAPHGVDSENTYYDRRLTYGG